MSIVETTYGRLEGVAREGHVAFLGIPFAAPAGGERRFRAPTPPSAWSGVRGAKEWGNAARQSSHPLPGFAASGPQDEDCLYLNVFTPAADGRRRPVLFWIHGGGFTHGTAAEAMYNGGPLAVRGDVVVVSINYRLGALGYLYLGEHLPNAGLTANAGQLDQVAALRWVRDNAEAFGGDPSNVTIFGESAGAAAVGTLLAMPAAKGLFHRAILESGTGRATPADVAAGLPDAVLKELGIERTDAASILSVSADAIIAAQQKAVARSGFGVGPAFGPVCDGVTLLESPLAAIRTGKAADIPVLIGTNRDEVKLFVATVRREPMEDGALLKAIAATIGRNEADAAGLTDVYRTSRRAKGLPDANLDVLDAIQTDARMRIPATRLALAQRAHQPNTFAYLFTYASPARGGSLGACHALELPFVFGTISAPGQAAFAGTGPDVERLSTNMMDSWLSFAKSGKPAHESLGPWAPYDDATRTTMVFDRSSAAEDDPFGEERKAIEAFV
jgi:para-nitrobenzyl esterase